MNSGSDILLIGGASETPQLAVLLAQSGMRARAVLPDAPAADFAVPWQKGLWQGAEVPASLSGVRAVIDASHSFEPETSRAIAQAAQAQKVPYLRLLRAPWQGHRGVDTVAAALAALPAACRLFSATGWPSLGDFAAFPGARVFFRQSEPHDKPAPFDFITFVFGPPPYSVAAERALFQRLGITHLLCRNLGGMAGRSKIDAAAALGIQVILLNQPPAPQGAQVVQTPAAAVAWACCQ